MKETKWRKVKCSKCGKLKNTNPQVYANRLAKYGSEEEIQAKWICRECKRSEKNLTPKPKKEKTLKDKIRDEMRKEIPLAEKPEEEEVF